jgi:hypothetical protein
MAETQTPAALVPTAAAAATATAVATDAPTLTVAGEFQRAYDHFNQELFDGALPAAVITMQRRPRSAGYFVPDRFARVDDDGATQHEIALNPSLFRQRPAIETLATLVREMVGLWQHSFGHPSRRGYGNQEWAEKMRAVGLPPSGTGQKVVHAILPRGPFERAADAFLKSGGRITYGDLWLDVEEGAGARQRGQSGGARRRAAKRASKTTFRCPACGIKAWSRSSARIACIGPEGKGPHEPTLMLAEEAAED